MTWCVCVCACVCVCVCVCVLCFFRCMFFPLKSYFAMRHRNLHWFNTYLHFRKWFEITILWQATLLLFVVHFLRVASPILRHSWEKIGYLRRFPLLSTDSAPDFGFHDGSAERSGCPKTAGSWGLGSLLNLIFHCDWGTIPQKIHVWYVPRKGEALGS